MRDAIDLLVTLDEAYLPRLEVLITSILASNVDERFRLHLLHREISKGRLDEMARSLKGLPFDLCPQKVADSLFESAPTSKRYPQEMYYRLAAPHLLPADVRRVIYLDPDTLVINPLRPLWEVDLGDHALAAAAHTALPGAGSLAEGAGRVRLGTEGRYFNSGVLLIDTKAMRDTVALDNLISYARTHHNSLLLPDQDLLNALYGSRILEIDEKLWNYDARRYYAYLLATSGQADVDWVICHTAVLHFCGKPKPWMPLYRYRFGSLYKHYQHLARRLFGQDASWTLSNPAAFSLQAHSRR